VRLSGSSAARSFSTISGYYAGKPFLPDTVQEDIADYSMSGHL